MEIRERFDYEKMAQEAARERDALHAVLEKRRAHPPTSGEQEMIWRRETGMLYKMYLEQRGCALELGRRARARKEADYAK